MPSSYELIQELTRDEPRFEESGQLLSEFSYRFGWRPSSVGDWRGPARIGNLHLVVEHGLDNTAVLTFLARRVPSSQLQPDQLRQLLSLSYNNLVDWHILVESNRVSYLYNRTEPITTVESSAISEIDYSALDHRRFRQAIGAAPNPNIPALDDALIRTISKWRRLLTSELGLAQPNRPLSALFNAILLCRGVEDLAGLREDALLLNLIDRRYPRVSDVFRAAISSVAQIEVPDSLLDIEALSVFDHMDAEILRSVFRDFYRQEGVPYPYDFSVMSKHALSRIYEKYVSLLRFEETAQLSYWPRIPTEEAEKSFGAVYTPQYIATFFARFLQDNLPPSRFKKSRATDFACGSGIFLRSLFEAELEAMPVVRHPEEAGEALRGLLGVDIDENACSAAKLSLALLFLVACGRFPRDIAIVNSDAIEYFLSHSELRGSFDAFLINPPFVRTESQSPDTRERISGFMQGITRGKIDSYMPFTVMGVEALEPGGFGMFVLPHTILTSDSGRDVLRWVLERVWVRCLADLSSLPVFGRLGSYVILLIVQRRLADAQEPSATVIRCKSYPGHALQDFLDGKLHATPNYSIYEVTQGEVAETRGTPLPPHEALEERVLAALPRLSDYAYVGQGIITGADDVFVVPTQQIPHGEEEAYRDYLPDRAITQYALPEDTGVCVFYPFSGDEKMTSEDVASRFPRTWERLSSARERLEKRSPVARGDIEWWQLAWPRKPSRILSPKIVGPHIQLLPRFGFDDAGRWLVSHSQYIAALPTTEALADDLLHYLTALLNSDVAARYFYRHARKYRSGYSRIEVGTLRSFPVPDPTSAPGSVAQIIRLVRRLRDRITGKELMEVRSVLEEAVAKIYRLEVAQREVVSD